MQVKLLRHNIFVGYVAACSFYVISVESDLCSSSAVSAWIRTTLPFKHTDIALTADDEHRSDSTDIT